MPVVAMHKGIVWYTDELNKRSARKLLRSVTRSFWDSLLLHVMVVYITDESVLLQHGDAQAPGQQ